MIEKLEGSEFPDLMWLRTITKINELIAWANNQEKNDKVWKEVTMELERRLQEAVNKLEEAKEPKMRPRIKADDEMLGVLGHPQNCDCSLCR